MKRFLSVLILAVFVPVAASAAVLTSTTVTRAGIDVVGVAAAAGGDSFANTGKEFIEVKNGGAGAITVTLDVQTTLDGMAITDPTVSIAAGATKIIGPFPTHIFNDSNSRVNVTYSAVTSVTVKVLTINTAG